MPEPQTGPLSGVYFDGLSSRDHPATLHLRDQSATLSVPGAGVGRTWPAAEVTLDPGTPGVRRVLKFPDGSRFETPDTAAVAAWERQQGRNRLHSGMRGLEARWSTALGALVLAVGAVALFLIFGLPVVARQAAAATPRPVLATFDRETLALLEGGGYIGPSRLSAARQAQLQAGFRRVSAWAGGGYPYRLLLRSGEPEPQGEDTSGTGTGMGTGNGIGPNAFALPNGTIVMTDQLVGLAKSDRELLGVLAHESAHVTRRHGLAGVYQALGLTLVTTVVTGDLISASTFAAAVPAALLRGGYSRAAETESDELAARYLLREYGTTRPLADLLGRLDAELGQDEDAGVLDLLRSHPGTAQRIEHLRRLEEEARR